MRNHHLSRCFTIGSLTTVIAIGLLVPAFAIASSGKFEVASERRILEIPVDSQAGELANFSKLSPNGESVLTIQSGRLTIRALESAEDKELLPMGSIAPVIHQYWAVWSADSRQIYYLQRGDRVGIGNLWRLDIASRKTGLLIKNTGPVSVSPSPDGKSVAFYRGNNLILAGTDGKSERVVCDHCMASQYDLVWSPDSSQIVFLYGNPDQGVASLSLLTLANGQVTPLRPWKGFINSIVWPSWSSGPLLCVHVANQASAYSR